MLNTFLLNFDSLFFNNAGFLHGKQWKDRESLSFPLCLLLHPNAQQAGIMESYSTFDDRSLFHCSVCQHSIEYQVPVTSSSSSLRPLSYHLIGLLDDIAAATDPCENSTFRGYFFKL